jgi:hypothetical protein
MSRFYTAMASPGSVLIPSQSSREVTGPLWPEAEDLSTELSFSPAPRNTAPGPEPKRRAAEAHYAAPLPKRRAASSPPPPTLRAARVPSPPPGVAPRATCDNPDFVGSFFANSRLHFIGAWRSRYEALARARPPPPPLRPPPRGRPPLVLHVDLDCFFAAVAAQTRPALAGKPFAVCWGAGHGGCAHP